LRRYLRPKRWYLEAGDHPGGADDEKLNLPVISLPFTASGLIDFQKPVREFHIERFETVH